MKRTCLIGTLLMCLAFAACHRPNDEAMETQQAPDPLPVAFPELSAIDSLMWQRPDSALICLLPWFDTCCRDAMLASPPNETDTALETHSMRLYNRHYAHLLLAELLYKNDYAQTNRTELLQAVDYFDSLLVVMDERGADTRGVSQQRPARRDASHASTQNVSVAFMAARAHYINGVGHYEQGQAAEACAEYLKALETMESHYTEKELVGKKARFMTYIYNRLGDLFSAQFMMEPAITSYQQSLVYCKIAPTSPFGVSNTLKQLGKQYDKLGQKEKAREYYEQALEELPIQKGHKYRDIIASKALCDYQLGMGIGQPLDALRQVLAKAESENEVYTRYLTIGDIFFEEGIHDSALVYLKPVFESDKNITRKVRAADFLRIIYDSLGQEDKADECMRFLAKHKKSEGENKALVSQLEGLFQSYLSQKQEQRAAQEKREAVKKTVKILVPIALVAAVLMVLAIRRRGKRHLETARQTHRMEQAALSGRLKRSNEKLRDVSRQLEQTLAKNSLIETESPDDYSAFVNAPICLYIVRLVHEQLFKSKMDYLIYKESALSREQLLALRDAAEKHLPRFVLLLRKEFSSLTDIDIDYCYLFLLGLNEADISALMQRAYTTVCDRSRKISRIIGANDSLYQTLRSMLSER